MTNENPLDIDWAAFYRPLLIAEGQFWGVLTWPSYQERIDSGDCEE